MIAMASNKVIYRGSLVMVNESVTPSHLAGTVGIALERVQQTGYIRVLSEYEGWLTDLAYQEAELEVLEGPVRL